MVTPIRGAGRAHRILPMSTAAACPPDEVAHKLFSAAISRYGPASTNLHCDIDGAVEVHRKRAIVDFPCMVRSSFCNGVGLFPKDPGGWFCISGVPKVIINQLKVRHDIPLVHHGMPDAAQCRSSHPNKWRSSSTLNLTVSKQDTMLVEIPFVFSQEGIQRQAKIPLHTCLNMCGCDVSASEYAAALCTPHASVVAAFTAYIAPGAETGISAVEWFDRNVRLNGKTALDYITSALRTEFLPHISNPIAKAVYLTTLACRLIENRMGLRQFPPKDDIRECGACAGSAHPKTDRRPLLPFTRGRLQTIGRSGSPACASVSARLPGRNLADGDVTEELQEQR